MVSGTPPVARTSDSLVRTFILILLTNVEFTLTKSTPNSFKGTLYSTFQSSVTETETNKSSAVEESTEKQSHTVFGRDLLQQRRRSRVEGESSFNISCQTLTTSFYNESSHIWILNREALEFTNYDLQSIIDCTNEDDTLLFQTNQTIKPARTLNISMSLTLSSRYQADSAENKSFLTASEMVRFTCPDSGQLIKSSSPNLTLRGLMIEDCNSTASIIELELDCNAGRPERSVRLLQLVIGGNNLSSPARIVDSKAPACFHLEMDDVMIRQNNCSSESCVTLSSRNELNNINLLDNVGASQRSLDMAIFLATEGSNTIATNVRSEQNKIKTFNVSSGILTIVDSNFMNNEARGNGGIILAHSYSTLTFLRSYFSRNIANFGGALFLEGSSIANISECIFANHRAYISGGVAYLSRGSMVILNSTTLLNNNAAYGGALYVVESSNGHITNCNFTSNIATNNGGAINIYINSTLTLLQSKVSSNNATYGGVLYLQDSSNGKVLNCDLTNNKATSGGGAIYLYINSSLYLHRSNLSSNEARYGGALYVEDFSNGSISNCNLINNLARNNGGSINIHINSTLTLRRSKVSSNNATQGGALYVEESSNGYISNCNFTNNIATSNGGAINIHINSTITLLQSNLSSNEARYGGALYVEDFSNGSISNCNFTNNIATNNGGSINVHINSTLTLRRSKVSSNNATQGGALYLEEFSTGKILDCDFTSNIATSSGGAVHTYNTSSLTLQQSNFSSNEARYGGALYAQESSNGNISNCNFTNNIARNNGGAINIYIYSTFTLHQSNFSSNEARYGGALYVEDFSNGSISNCNLINNLARNNGGSINVHINSTLTLRRSKVSSNNATHGGALYLENSSNGRILDCNFTNNIAISNGGAINIHINSTITLLQSNLSSNAARYGGALYLEDFSNGSISNCNLINNIARNNGGSINVHINSTLTLRRSKVSSNNATQGGALYLEEFSTGKILDCDFTSNIATSSGGAVHTYNTSSLTLQQSNFSSNEARYGGALYARESSNGNISNCNFTHNIATYNGGAINIYVNSTFTLHQSNFLSNEARYGGALYAQESSNGNISNCNLANNKASSSGGAIYIYINSTLYLHQSNLSSNEARYGGALYAALFNIVTTTCTKFSNNTARSTGGAISVKNTTLTLENTTIQLNEARKDCGGVCAIEVSEVFARNVTIHSNVAKNVGGGIGIGNGSSILCYACNISNNNAFSGAGLHVSINDLILIVVQLQNSNFENNSVRSYGSGTTFTTPMKRINNCNSSNDTCGHIVLLNINFEGNRASPNGVTIPTLNTNGVLIDCEYKRGSAQDFLNQTILSSLEQYDPKKSCLQRERDLLHVNDDGVIVGTLSQVITLSIAHDNDEVGLIWNAIDGYILKNVSSGRQLPRIYITVLNGFGGDLMFSLPNSFVARLYSSDRLFYGEYFTDSFIGSGHFSNATLFARPGNYSLEIRSNLPPIWAINVTVNVRECFVGEEPIEDPFTCQLCDALSYNFDASNISRCTPCPLDGSCQGRYIVPKKGHWHKSPCHNNTQKCIVEEACSLDDRTDVLMNFTANFTNCNMNETELDTYSEKLCHKGYQGPLCGSCNQTFGLSSRFMCRECTSNILSLLVIIGVTLYLLGATVVTIRGCLPSNLTHRESHLETYQSLNVARPSDIDQQVNIQMAETNDDGNVPQEQLATNDSINTSETETSKLQQETEFKVTRWKITEIFKIMINFLQTTGVAATLNVPWTEEMNTMFATSDYIGGLTTDAISRPVDCLVSSGSTSLKALWRIMVSVSIPLIVLGILTSFWGYITIKNDKDRQHFLKRFILSAISVAYISYLGLTKMAVRAFYCVDVYDSVDHLEQSTTRLWAVDTSIRCYEEDHAGIIVIAVLVLLLITICYPLLSFIALYINKENVRSGDKGIFEIAGFLFRAFKEKFLFWESIVMLRKACLSVICVFSYSLGGDSQLLLVSVLLFFCLYLQLTLRPYREDFKILNHFESISLLVSGLTFSLGQFFIEGRCNDYIKTFLVVLLIFGNSMFFLLLLLALFYNSMVHLRVTLQCENIPLPVPPIWWNILKVYIHSRYTKWRQLHN